MYQLRGNRAQGLTTSHYLPQTNLDIWSHSKPPASASQVLELQLVFNIELLLEWLSIHKNPTGIWFLIFLSILSIDTLNSEP